MNNLTITFTDEQAQALQAFFQVDDIVAYYTDKIQRNIDTSVAAFEASQQQAKNDILIATFQAAPADLQNQIQSLLSQVKLPDQAQPADPVTPVQQQTATIN